MTQCYTWWPGEAFTPDGYAATCRRVPRCANLWERWDEAAEGLKPWHAAQDQQRAIGSAGERLVHTEEVTGSIPVSPTSSEAMWIFAKISTGAIPVAK